jgi:urocanate hydratase
VNAGVTIVADGNPATAERLKRVLNGDPGIGVLAMPTPATNSRSSWRNVRALPRRCRWGCRDSRRIWLC